MAGKKIIGNMNIVQFAGLLLLLVLLPLGSWYYLQTGLDYRIQAKEELDDIAPLPTFELQNYNDSIVQMDLFKDQLVVGHFSNAASQAVYAQTLQKLHEQFDERSDVYFLAFQADTSARARIKTAMSLFSNRLNDREQIFLLSATPSKVEQLAAQMKLPLEEKGMTLEDNSLLFFVDSAMVRGFYDMSQEAELKRLVKHLTLNLHPVEEADIIFEPETEK
jgi:hypothetical protein